MPFELYGTDEMHSGRERGRADRVGAGAPRSDAGVCKAEFGVIGDVAVLLFDATADKVNHNERD